LVLVLFVFNPGDFNYLGYKKLMTTTTPTTATNKQYQDNVYSAVVMAKAIECVDLSGYLRCF